MTASTRSLNNSWRLSSVEEVSVEVLTMKEDDVALSMRI
jgi:hypothetical protein